MTTALLMAVAAAGMGPDAPPGGEPAVPIDIIVPNADISVTNVQTYSEDQVFKDHTVAANYTTLAGDKIVLSCCFARAQSRTATAKYGANSMTEIDSLEDTSGPQNQYQYMWYYDVTQNTTADVEVNGSGDLNRMGAEVKILRFAASGAQSAKVTETTAEDPGNLSITPAGADEEICETTGVHEDPNGIAGSTTTGQGQVSDAAIEDIDSGSNHPISFYSSHLPATTSQAYTIGWNFPRTPDVRTAIAAAFAPGAGKVTSATASNSITLSGISVTSGDKLIVRVGYETHTSRTLVATYDGTSMTSAIQQEYTGGSGGSGGIPGAAIFYLDITATKSSKDVVVSTSPSGDVEQWAVFATILQKAATGAPEATAQTNGNQDPTNTNITTVNDEALVLDVIACREPSTLSITQSGSPEQQVEMDKVEQFDSDTAMGISRYAVSTAQQVTLGWDEATASPTGAAHVLAAFTAGTTGDPPPTPPAAMSVSGTLFTNNQESDVVAGGETIILDIVDPNSPATQWVAAGSTFDNQRQNIINGIDGSGSEANGWDAERSNLPVTNVVRTSNTRVTITLSALTNYDISEDEQLQITVPATALTGAAAIVGIPNITIRFEIQTGDPPPEANYFVDSQNGSDSKNGQTRSNAWKNLTKVNSVSFAPGDVIGFVAGSSWSGQRLEPKSSGNASNYIEFIKIDAGADPVINAASAPGGRGMLIQNKHHIRIREFEVKNGSRGIEVLGGNNIEIHDCEAHDTSGNGIHAENTKDFLAKGCNAHHNGSGPTSGVGGNGHGFRAKGTTTGTWDSCQASFNHEDGFQCDITNQQFKTIKNCTFFENYEDAVDCKGGDIEILDCNFYNNQRKTVNMHKRCGSITCRRTILKGAKQFTGVHVDENGGAAHSDSIGKKNEKHLFESCIIIDNAKSGFHLSDWGQEFKIYHCTLWNNNKGGNPEPAQIYRKNVQTSGLEAKNLEIKNCIVGGSNSAALQISTGKSEVTENNNILRTNSGTAVKIIGATYNNTEVQNGTYSSSEGASFGSNTISTAPTFENVSNEDFRLKTGSAGIDAGDDTVSTTLDHDSNTFGSPPNIGAHDVNT